MTANLIVGLIYLPLAIFYSIAHRDRPGSWFFLISIVQALYIIAGGLGILSELNAIIGSAYGLCVLLLGLYLSNDIWKVAYAS